MDPSSTPVDAPCGCDRGCIGAEVEGEVDKTGPRRQVSYRVYSGYCATMASLLKHGVRHVIDSIFHRTSLTKNDVVRIEKLLLQILTCKYELLTLF